MILEPKWVIIHYLCSSDVDTYWIHMMISFIIIQVIAKVLTITDVP
jgi:hypothetical protein